ncbi:MAG: alpha-2-macroglobulin family protein [Bacteroidota bacterium]
MLLRRYLTLCLLFFSAPQLSAQDYLPPPAWQGLVPVTAATIDQLTSGEEDLILGPQHLRDTLYPLETPLDSLPYGHYLIATINAQQISYRIRQHFPYELWVGSRRRKLAVRFFDEQGQDIQDAELRVDGRKLRWSATDSAYLRRDWQVENLQVIHGQDTLYYRLEDQQYRSRFHNLYRRASRNPLGFVVLFPVRAIDNSIRYLDRGISRGDWRWHHYPFRRQIQGTPIPIYGYATSAQPDYRPGDSVQLSFFCSKNSGRPIKDSVTLIISSGYGEQRFVREVGTQSLAPGHYQASFILGEEWPLDRTFSVNPRFEQHRRWEFQPYVSFRTQDYQLEEFSLDLEVPERLTPAEVLKIQLKASDVNGLPIAGGRIELQMIFQQALAAEEGFEGLIPDTLWSDTLTLSTETELEISIPQEQLPQHIHYRAGLIATLFTPGGETQQALQSITLDQRHLERPQIAYQDGYIRLFNRHPAGQDTATLIRHFRDRRSSQSVILPDTLPLDPAVRNLELRLGEHSTRMYQEQLVEEAKEALQWSGLSYLSPAQLNQQIPDSLAPTKQVARLYLPLPTQSFLDFRWSVRSPQDEPLLSGTATDLPNFYDLPPTQNEVVLDYRWRLAGEWINGQQTLSWAKEELTIDIEQPRRVLPGETVAVTLRVRDDQNQPVSGARLSSGTYNARFDDQPYSNISARSRGSRTQEGPQFREQDQSPSGQLRLPQYWVERLGWDSLHYYQIRFAKDGYEHYRPLPDSSRSRAELAPFISRRGELQAIVTFSVNNEIRFYDKVWGQTPYSVPVDTGRISVQIRTRKAVYERELYSQAGQQLVVSFDLDHFARAGWTKRVMDPFPTTSELHHLERRVMGLQTFEQRREVYGLQQVRRLGGHYFLSMGHRHRPYYLGLFNQGVSLDFHNALVDSVRLKFEHGFSYAIEPGRDRLYPLEFPEPGSSYFRHFTTRENPGFAIYKALPYPAGRWQAKSDLLSRDRSQTEGPSLQLLSPSAAAFTQLGIRGADHKYILNLPANQRLHLASGSYELYLFGRGDSILQRSIELPESGTRILSTQEDQDWQRQALTDSLRATFFELKSEQFSQVEEYHTSYSNLILTNGMVSGRILDEETKEPLIAALIHIQVNNRATQAVAFTDFDGNFSFRRPIGLTGVKVSYTGYQDNLHQIRVYSAGNIGLGDITLASEVSLYSVMVVGYGSTSRRNTSINIRGSRSNASYYYVDGIRYEAPLVQQDNTTSGSFVTSEEIRALPTRDISGLVMGTSVGLTAELHDLNPERANWEIGSPTLSGGLRNSFADLAHFVPYLMTDQRGEARFQIQYPDDITAWNTFAIGQDRRRRAGLAVQQTQAYLPVQAQLYLPRFLVEGDRSTALGVAINREANPQVVELQFGDGETVSSRERVELVQLEQRSYPIATDQEADSVRYQFGLVNDQIQDGEQRSIQVFPRGSQVCNGRLDYLRDESLQLGEGFDPQLGDLEVSILHHPTDYLQQDIAYLKDYPYDCNEQLAGKLMGYLAEKLIDRFIDQSNDRAIERILHQIEKNQLPSGGYGWWPGQTRATRWISLHIFRALLAAEKQGYPSAATARLQQYLLAEIQVEHPSLQAQLLLLLAEADQLNELDYRLQQIDSLATNDTYYHLISLRLRQLRGDSIDWQQVIELGQDYYGRGLFWEPDHNWTSRQPLAPRTAATILAFQILQTAGQAEAAQSALLYLLSQGHQSKQRFARLGRNSLESGLLVLSLAPHLQAELNWSSSPEIQLIRGGSITPLGPEPESFVLPAHSLRTAELRIQGGAMVISRRQCRWEEEPLVSENGLSVSTNWANDPPILNSSDAFTLEAIVELPADADYVLVEIPIPAGAEYANHNEFRGPYAVQREYRRDRVAVFCDHLPAGNHRFKVALRGRFPGEYTLNPVRAELQYLPAITANAAIQQLQIED